MSVFSGFPGHAAVLALLRASAAPAALAQQATANNATVGISQEQLLALTARLDALEKRNEELEAQVLDLKAAQVGGDQALRQQLGANTVSLANGRPTLATGDGQFTASLRGIVQFDAAQYDQRRPGPLATDFRRGSLGDATEADRARDLSDGTNFRRVRFGIEGKAWGDWAYNLLFDFGGSGVEDPGKIINAYVEYAGFAPLRLRAGAFAPTSGLEDATPNTAGLFLERAAVAELVRNLAAGDGRTGVAALANGERWSLFGAVTGATVATQNVAAQKRQFTLQAEYFWLDVQRRNSALADPKFNGWYVQGAWTLTGQARRYNPAAGGFDQPRIDKPFSPRGKSWGAFELAARYSD